MSALLDDLSALRELLWESLREAPADKRAALAKQLTDVIQAIDALTPTAKAGDPLDEIAARRSARGGATSRLGEADGSQG